MNNQMSVMSFFDVHHGLKEPFFQLFDVQLLLSHQLQYFKAARNNLTKIS